MRIERIKQHFEQEAAEYDTLIRKLIPRYAEMIEALVAVIPFKKERVFEAIDLGCGTGTLSKAVKEGFPGAKFTCVDISGRMLEITTDKLGGDVRCIEADLYDFDFPQRYDLVVSSLALHHLETDDDKLAFYKKIRSALNPGGVMVVIDVVLAEDDRVQQAYMDKWREFLAQSIPEEDIDTKWMPSYYAEDRPTRLSTHLEMLAECGFVGIDVVYKYYNYAVLFAATNVE